MTQVNEAQLAYRISDAGVQLGGLGRTKIYELIASGRLRAVKIDGRTVVPRKSIERFLEECLVESVAKSA